MNKYFAALSVTALISIAPYALAASSTDMSVTGTITPNACTPSLSGGGLIDYGKISSSDLNKTRPTVLAKHTLTMAVACDSATTFALNPIDNRADSAFGTTSFGLGLINANQKLGEYEIRVGNAVADTTPVLTIASQNKGNSWFGSSYWNADFYMGVNTVNSGPPIAVRDLTMDLEITATIVSADQLNLASEVNIDGSATFEVKYL